MRAVRQQKPEKLGTAGTGEKLTPIIKILYQHSYGHQWSLADHRRSRLSPFVHVMLIVWNKVLAVNEYSLHLELSFLGTCDYSPVLISA